MLRRTAFSAFLIVLTPAFAAAQEPAPTFAITGSVDTYAAMSPGASAVALRAFDTYTNDLSFSYAEVAVERAAAPVGLRMDLGFGPTADVVNATDAAATGGYDLMRNVQQAYVSWRAADRVTLRLGKFVTWFGQEVIEAQGNWSYSRGLLFTCAIPFTHTGVAVTWSASPRLEVTGFVTNGLNNTFDSNEFKSPGLQVIARPGAWTLVANYGVFNELAGDRGEILDFGEAIHLLDLIAQVAVGDRIDLAVNADLGYDAAGEAAGDRTFWGVAAYARAHLAARADAALRAEYFADSASPTLGFLGMDGDAVETTGTLSFTPATGLLLRLEGRWDHALGGFRPFDGGADADQVTVTAAAIAGF